MPWSSSRPKGSTRGYGYGHAKARAAYMAQLERDGAGVCCICGRTITPGMDLHLDHSPDRQTYRGLAHAVCNRRDGAKRGRDRQTVTARSM
jgi:hypothetical protein